MPDLAPAKILVADDDQSLVRTLMWILKENGYEVVVAPGGEGLMGKLEAERPHLDRKSTRLNSSHSQISYAVFCLKKKKTKTYVPTPPTTKTKSTSAVRPTQTR